MQLQKINNQTRITNNQKNKTDNQPSFNATLRIYNPAKLIDGEQDTFLFKKAQKINCNFIYAWLESPNIPIEVQIVKEKDRSHVELLEDVMPMINGEETSKLAPFDAISGWLDMLAEKYI